MHVSPLSSQIFFLLQKFEHAHSIPYTLRRLLPRGTFDFARDRLFFFLSASRTRFGLPYFEPVQAFPPFFCALFKAPRFGLPAGECFFEIGFRGIFFFFFIRSILKILPSFLPFFFCLRSLESRLLWSFNFCLFTLTYWSITLLWIITEKMFLLNVSHYEKKITRSLQF